MTFRVFQQLTTSVMSVAWLDENFQALQNQITALSGSPVGGIQVYNTVQTNTPFVIPAGVTKLKVTVIGGGGGGQNALSGAGGGGGGGTAIKFLSNLTPGNTLLITVGAGGASATNGVSGGSSSVGPGTQAITAVTATGGAGSSGSTGAAGAGGTSSTGDWNIPGQAGDNGETINVNFGPCFNATYYIEGDGGGSAYGAGGRGAGGFPGGGGASFFAGATGAVIIEW